MGHAVGLNHEHQRCDREQFLDVNMSWLERYGNFLNNSPICNWGEDIGPFNYSSIMLYGPSFGYTAKTQTWNTNWRGTKGIINWNLDDGDIQDGLSALYP